MHPIERLRYVARAGDADPSLLAEEAALALGDLGGEPRALVPACRRLIEFHPGCAPLWWVCAELLGADDPFGRAEELAEALRDDPTSDELAAALPGAATVVTTGGPIIDAALQERPDLAVHLVASAGELRYRLRRMGERVDVSGFLDEEVDEACATATLVLVEAEALGPQGALLAPDAAAVVREGAGIETWVVAARGRMLPGPLFDELRRRTLEPPRFAAPRRYPELDADEDETVEKVLHLVAVEELAVVVGPEGAERPTTALSRLRCPVPAELLVSAGR